MNCAQRGERFGECLSLNLCVGANTTHEILASELFPSDFYVPVYHDAVVSYLLNGTCNVLLTDLHAERTAELEMEAGRVPDVNLSAFPRIRAAPGRPIAQSGLHSKPNSSVLNRTKRNRHQSSTGPWRQRQT